MVRFIASAAFIAFFACVSAKAQTPPQETAPALPDALLLDQLCKTQPIMCTVYITAVLDVWTVHPPPRTVLACWNISGNSLDEMIFGWRAWMYRNEARVYRENMSAYDALRAYVVEVACQERLTR